MSRMGTWRLEYGANLDGEGLAVPVALVGADPGALALHLRNAVNAAAMRANRTPRPYPGFHPRVGDFLIVETFGLQSRTSTWLISLCVTGINGHLSTSSIFLYCTV